MLPNISQDRLTILHTNDLHSHFGAMGRISAIIEQERTSIGAAPVLLLDIGDHMDRAAVETEGTGGQCNVDVLNLTGYDAITIGNNEGLTLTPDMLEQAYAGLSCPVICTNIVEKATGQPPIWMQRHAIIERGGFTIGLIGATAAFADFYQLLGWDALAPIPAIEAEVAFLRPKVDLVVVMSHLGLALDKELAEKVPGIDLILGGHTHHLLQQPLFVQGTAVAAAEKFGHYVGKVDVIRDPHTGKAVVSGGICLSVEEGEHDPEVDHAIAIHLEHAKERLARSVAVMSEELDIDYTEESSLGNLLAQSVRRFTGAEVSLVNSGQLLGPLPKGEISEGLLHALCPSPINPCVMKLSGEDLLYTLEESLIPEISQKSIHGYGFRGKILGSICVDGMEVLYDTNRMAYDRIIQASIQGKPILPGEQYRVGTLDMFTFGIGYRRLQNGRDKTFMLPEFLRDLLRLELQTPGAWETSKYPRWHKKM
ncbi:multifunctional 2',3'-cyclic-nucleotide 2'-phosphodiesterase/5'-nucleotidase/3'-nucleotidase [Paenibacillus sp. CAA11]|uniref:bifunctional metallophosphatase/5'-nucleotidase n=1 Tax=Paenibacillus sp. CAA11 TaxID=1532905 RepID=UPI000D3495F9|nr:bifunctional UDP-sugar hydrolase/5'-nucleotidase [Paenibacillus sp. CAA11]AWB44023.1 multifunctional 2',3'-cyclic-nucleotide 2'-phosphodiesterase/5'-nucleotidase/3'-nucleotidase [Paenibacillus sp. CAA11]